MFNAQKEPHSLDISRTNTAERGFLFNKLVAQEQQKMHSKIK